MFLKGIFKKQRLLERMFLDFYSAYFKYLLLRSPLCLMATLHLMCHKKWPVFCHTQRNILCNTADPGNLLFYKKSCVKTSFVPWLACPLVYTFVTSKLMPKTHKAKPHNRQKARLTSKASPCFFLMGASLQELDGSSKHERNWWKIGCPDLQIHH